jgi:hypothetical protein
VDDLHTALLALNGALTAHGVEPADPPTADREAGRVRVALERTGLPHSTTLVEWFTGSAGAIRAGVTRSQQLELLPGWRPLTLREALLIREREMVAHSALGGASEDDRPLWPGHWIPLLTDDRDALVVFSCALDSGDAPLFLVSLAASTACPAYDGLTALARTAEEGWRSGAYVLRGDGTTGTVRPRHAADIMVRRTGRRNAIDPNQKEPHVDPS